MPTTRIPKQAQPLPNDSRVKELKAALDRDPFNINLRLMLAAALENSGKRPDAVKVLQDTVEKARRLAGAMPDELRHLWLDLQMFDSQPLTRTLSGLVLEYQQFQYGTHVSALAIPEDKRFNISFSLGGIGTFSNFLGALAGQPTRR